MRQITGEVLPRELNAEAMVVQSNSLTRGYYPISLKTDAIRLLMSAIAKLDNDADMLGDVHISSGEMRRIFASYQKSKSYNAKIEDAAERIMGLIAHVNLPGGGWQKLSLIRKTIYSHGAVQIIFDPEAKPLLLRLHSGNYTSYPVRAIASLTTTPQILLYQWARSFAHLGHWEASPKDVRAVLNKNEEAYKEEHRFIKWVLKPAIDGVNNDENADVNITVRPLKRGREILGYSFRVSLREGANLSIADKVSLEILIEEGIAPQIANKAIRENGCSQCLRAIVMVRLRASRADQPPLTNKSAYLAKLLIDKASPELSDPSYRQLEHGFMLQFRQRVFERLGPETKNAHFDAFSQSLTGRAATDWAMHKRPDATGILMQAWAAYINQHIASAGAGIVITKTPTKSIRTTKVTGKSGNAFADLGNALAADPEQPRPALEEGDEI